MTSGAQADAAMLIDVQWPAPAAVRCFCTTRRGGVSRAPFDDLNLASAGGDNAQHVAANVQRLSRAAALPHRPIWPRQVHGTTVIAAEQVSESIEADAVFTESPNRVCTVRTADCLPVLLCSRDGRAVAAAHAGWRGLQAGVLEASVQALGRPGDDIIAWLGPAIGAHAYEVGAEVREAFIEHDSDAASAFKRLEPANTSTPLRGGWLADLYALARQRLHGCGVDAVYGGDWCTFSDPQRFFSYRRDGVTGRMACGIWIAEPADPARASA